MSIFSVFQAHDSLSFLCEERNFKHFEGVIRDQRHTTNQNMYEKGQKRFHLNFALAEP
jgi:hypothetical protein